MVSACTFMDFYIWTRCRRGLGLQQVGGRRDVAVLKDTIRDVGRPRTARNTSRKTWADGRIGRSLSGVKDAGFDSIWVYLARAGKDVFTEHPF